MKTWEIATSVLATQDFADSMKDLYLHFLKQPILSKVPAKIKDPVTITIDHERRVIGIKAEVECES